jgi:curved DNA-binding protein CbpA
VNNEINQAWDVIYDSCGRLLKDKSTFDKIKFYSSKPNELLDKLYIVAVVRQETDEAEIIFQILRDR